VFNKGKNIPKHYIFLKSDNIFYLQNLCYFPVEINIFSKCLKFQHNIKKHAFDFEYFWGPILRNIFQIKNYVVCMHV
jgi:hypothetical protein